MTDEQKDFIAKALGELEDDYIEEAAGVSSGNGRFVWRRWMTVAAACVCLLVGAGVVWDMWGSLTEGGSVVSPGEGVTLPEVEIEANNRTEDGQQSEQPGYVLYKDRVYRMGDGVKYDNLKVNTYLGESAGPEADKTELRKDFIYDGTFEGKLYAIEGVEDSFAIVLEQKEGEQVLLLQDNGITLRTGSDLYEERFHLADNYEEVECETGSQWYSENGTSDQPVHVVSDRSNAEIQNFITELNKGEVKRCKDVFSQEEVLSRFLEKNTKYTLTFRLKNNLQLELRVVDGGYVVYEGMRDICVKIPMEVISERILMQESEPQWAERFPFISQESESKSDGTTPKSGDISEKNEKDVLWIERGVVWEDDSQSSIRLYSYEDGSHPYMRIDKQKINLGKFSDGWYQDMEHNELEIVHDIDGDKRNEITLMFHDGAAETLTDVRMLKRNESGKWEMHELPDQLKLEHSDVKLKAKKGCKVEIKVPATGYKKTIDFSKRAYFNDYFKKEGEKAIIGVSRIIDRWENSRLVIHYYLYANNTGDEMGVLCQQVDWNGEKNCLEPGKTWYEHRIWE